MTATVGIDPRIQARRTAVRRGEGQRRLRRLRAVASVLGGLAIAYALTRSPVMDVDHVRIDADGVDRTTLTEAIGVRPGRPMTEVDPQAIADAVAALPSVRSVEVRRSWPNAVTVEVAAREPGVVLAGAGGGWLVADELGGIIATNDERPEDLVLVGGVGFAGRPGQLIPARYRPAAAVAAALPADLRARTERVTTGEDGRVELQLVDGGIVVFGTDDDAATAAAAAGAVAASVAPGCVERIDVTSPSAPVLRRSEVC